MRFVLSFITSFVLLLSSASVFAYSFGDVRTHQDLLYSDSFEALEKSLAGYEEAYIKNKTSKAERELYLSYDTFDLVGDKPLTHLDKWVKTHPKSHIPYVARGVYLQRLAWLTRGGKYVDETPKEQIVKAKKYMRKARADFEKAIAIRPQLTVPYAHLTNMAKSGFLKDRSPKDYFSEGLKADAGSLKLHEAYAYTLQEKWGAQPEEWKKLLSQIKAKSKKHPQLRSIKAIRASMYAEDLMYKGSYKKALSAIDWSLEQGKIADYYYIKYYILNKMGNPKQARFNLSKALKMAPQSRFYNETMAYAYHRAERWDKCVTHASRAIYRGEATRNMHGTRGYCYEKEGDLVQARKDYQASLKIQPDDAWAKEALVRVNKVTNPISFRGSGDRN